MKPPTGRPAHVRRERIRLFAAERIVRVRLDIVFDTVCPWCFIGKRRFGNALGQRPHIAIELRWRPFLLNPEMPPQGIDRTLYLERKFGNSYRVQRIQDAAMAAGREEGIDFDFASIRRMPNTLNSHRLIQWAEESDCQSELVDRIFHAYFVEGRDIGNIEVLSSLAEEVGLSGPRAKQHLESDIGLAAIGAENLRVRRLGVNGVPCFIFDQRYAMAGAQDTEMLARLMDIAVESEFERTLA